MNQEDLQRVYEAVAADLFAYVDRVCGNDADAEDVFQDTWARFLGSGFKGGSDLDARRYLFRIATNLMKDRMRWAGRWRFSLMPERMGRAPEGRYLDEIDTQRALEKLKPQQRSLLWLAYVEGMAHKEMADVLGVASASVRVMLSRARHKLAKQLGEGS